jgi:hypothetical protein
MAEMEQTHHIIFLSYDDEVDQERVGEDHGISSSCCQMTSSS